MNGFWIHVYEDNFARFDHYYTFLNCDTNIFVTWIYYHICIIDKTKFITSNAEFYACIEKSESTQNTHNERSYGFAIYDWVFWNLH